MTTPDQPEPPTPPERVTINLTGKATAALNTATEISGLNRTDVVNRALRVYAYLEQIIAAGGRVLVAPRGEDPQQIMFM